MIVNLEQLNVKLDKIADENLSEPMGRAIGLVQSQAQLKCPVGIGGGELRESILTDVRDNGHVGICYTNKEYATYVEFGTGPKGQASHVGISPDVNPVYTQEPWWIHESKIGRETAEFYHFHHVDTEDGRFYLCNGQAAQPFMYPALKDNEDNVMNIFEDDMKGKLND